MEQDLLSWQERGHLWLRLAIRALLLTLVLLLLRWVGLPLLSLLFPFVLALIVAWILNPAVRWLHRRSGIPRGVLTVLLLLLVAIIVGGVLFGVGWVAVAEVRSLWDNRQSVLEGITGGLASAWDSVGRFLEPAAQVIPLPQEFLTTGEGLISLLGNWISSLDFGSWISAAAEKAPNMVSNLSAFVVATVVFLMASYFITSDYPRLRMQFTDRFPSSARDFFRSVREIFMSAFGGYLKSQLLLSLGVFMILTVGFMVIGNPYGLLLAFGLAVLDFIPIVGAGTVMLPWAVIDVILGKFSEALGLMVIWGIIVLFRRVAEPKILGDQTGLSPILSLVGIYLGMQAGGVAGMILGPLLLLVFINLTKLGIFQPVLNDIQMATKDIAAILRTGRKPSGPEDKG